MSYKNDCSTTNRQQIEFCLERELKAGHLIKAEYYQLINAVNDNNLMDNEHLYD